MCIRTVSAENSAKISREITAEKQQQRNSSREAAVKKQQ